MYIITDVNITLLSINSIYYKDDIEDPRLVFLDRISEHLYNYYQVKPNMKLGDILSEDLYVINNELYLQKNKTEENLIEVFLYKKIIKRGFIYNTMEEIVVSVFRLKLETDLTDSVKTMEYIKIG